MSCYVTNIFFYEILFYCDKGCFREVWINHKLVDFGNAAHTQSVTPGCASIDHNPYESALVMEDEHNIEV